MAVADVSISQGMAGWSFHCLLSLSTRSSRPSLSVSQLADLCRLPRGSPQPAPRHRAPQQGRDGSRATAAYRLAPRPSRIVGNGRDQLRVLVTDSDRRSAARRGADRGPFASSTAGARQVPNRIRTTAAVIGSPRQVRRLPTNWARRSRERRPPAAAKSTGNTRSGSRLG